MPVYVDPLFVAKSKNPQAFRVGQRHGHQWCHFFADFQDRNLLHQIAARIGMRREWFDEDKDGGHYDLVPPKREAAIALGAIPVETEKAVHIWRRSRIEHRYASYLLQRPDLVEAGAVATAGVLPYVKGDGYHGPHGGVYLSLRHGTPRLRGLWGAAGGWVEQGEEILDAAMRELCEETGLVLESAGRLELLGFYPGSTDDSPPRHFITTQFALQGRGDETLEQSEPEKHGPWTFFPFAEALRLPLLPGFADVIRDLERKLHR